jgi:hypothetical protein
MKLKLLQHLLLGFCILAFPTLLSGQECSSQGNCDANCPPWFFRNGAGAIGAGVPSCTKIKTERIPGEHNSPECRCVLINPTAFCVPTGIKKDYCDGECPPVFATFQDAVNNTNPIEGECILVGNGNNAICACRYVK